MSGKFADRMQGHGGWDDGISLKQIAGICDPFVFSLHTFLTMCALAFEDCDRLAQLKEDLEDQIVKVQTPELRAVASRMLLTEFHHGLDPFYKRVTADDQTMIGDMYKRWRMILDKKLADGIIEQKEHKKQLKNSYIALLQEKYDIMNSPNYEDGEPKDDEDREIDIENRNNLWSYWRSACLNARTAALSLRMPTSVLQKAEEAQQKVMDCAGEDGVDIEQTIKVGHQIKGAVKKKERKQIKKLCKGKSKEEMSAMLGTTVATAKRMEQMARKQRYQRKREARNAALRKRDEEQEARMEEIRAKSMEVIDATKPQDLGDAPPSSGGGGSKKKTKKKKKKK